MNAGISFTIGTSIGFLIAFLTAILFTEPAKFKQGKQSQIKDNISHGVMDSNGEWLQEFWLAKNYVSYSDKVHRSKKWEWRI